MQCTVCKKQDTLSNLVAVKLSETTTGYAHQKCINRHNRAAAQNLREFDAAMIASEIFAYDIDATYPYAVETFLHDHKQHKQRLSRGRYPTIPEIVAAARKQRERENREAAFKTIEEKVGPLPAEADEALISEIAEELRRVLVSGRRRTSQPLRRPTADAASSVAQGQGSVRRRCRGL